MYEKIAWENFCKTGDVESFLEYRKISMLNQNIADGIQNVGELIDETYKSKRDSDKGSNI